MRAGPSWDDLPQEKQTGLLVAFAAGMIVSAGGTPNGLVEWVIGPLVGLLVAAVTYHVTWRAIRWHRRSDR